MPIYIFHRKNGFEPLNFHQENSAIAAGKLIKEVTRIEFAPTGRIVWEKPNEPKFKVGDRVRKIKGSQWQGRIVGAYSTELTPDGFCVESEAHAGSCQIYPASALELV